jgi:hypothetical protein
VYLFIFHYFPGCAGALGTENGAQVTIPADVFNNKHSRTSTVLQNTPKIVFFDYLFTIHYFPRYAGALGTENGAQVTIPADIFNIKQSRTSHTSNIPSKSYF